LFAPAFDETPDEGGTKEDVVDGIIPDEKEEEEEEEEEDGPTPPIRGYEY
jgi:hypothetical protein